MCYFIEVEVPTGTPLGDVARGLQVDPGRYAGLQPRLQHELWSITDGHCSCSLVRRHQGTAADRSRSRYEKMGWSEAKIQRALGDRARVQLARVDGSTEFEEWLCELAEQLGEVRVFVHWDSARLIPDREHRGIATTELRGGTRLPEETWVAIRRANEPADGGTTQDGAVR